jgi:hypothetical protein
MYMLLQMYVHDFIQTIHWHIHVSGEDNKSKLTLLGTQHDRIIHTTVTHNMTGACV